MNPSTLATPPQDCGFESPRHAAGHGGTHGRPAAGSGGQTRAELSALDSKGPISGERAQLN